MISKASKIFNLANIFVGACKVLSDVLAATEWVQTYPSLVRCLSMLPIHTPNKGVNNSYLEFG